MKYQQRVQLADKLIAAIESGGELLGEDDCFLQRQVQLYRDRMADATDVEEARSVVSALAHCWSDYGSFDSRYSPEIQKLLTPIRDAY
jgi:hypothetical protein